MFIIIPPNRETDKWGSGWYKAPRGSRTHNGIDKLAYAGSQVFSITKGKVTKLGYAYSDDLSFRYVQITDTEGYDLRYFYIYPIVIIGQLVDESTIIGSVQELGNRYPLIGNHFHFEVMHNKKIIDPNKYLKDRNLE